MVARSMTSSRTGGKRVFRGEKLGAQLFEARLPLGRVPFDDGHQHGVRGFRRIALFAGGKIFPSSAAARSAKRAQGSEGARGRCGLGNLRGPV